jgi:hypothetical protein
VLLANEKESERIDSHVKWEESLPSFPLIHHRNITCLTYGWLMPPPTHTHTHEVNKEDDDDDDDGDEMRKVLNNNLRLREQLTHKATTDSRDVMQA